MVSATPGILMLRWFSALILQFTNVFGLSFFADAHRLCGKSADGVKLMANHFFGHLEVISRLQVNPVLRGLSECLAEQQRHFSGYGPGALDDMGYSHGRKADFPAEFSLRNIQFFQHFFKKLTRVHRGKVVFGCHVLTPQ